MAMDCFICCGTVYGIIPDRPQPVHIGSDIAVSGRMYSCGDRRYRSVNGTVWKVRFCDAIADCQHALQG